MPIDDVRRLLEQANRVLVASHIDPDGDAIGTQLAFAQYLRDMGKSVVLVRDGEIPHKYRFLDGADKITPVEELDQIDVDTAIILECPTLERIGRASEHVSDDIAIINIDHHRDNDNFGAINWLNTEASSVGEMASEYFLAVDYPITRAVAEQLYTAIMTDTGRFRFSSTTKRAMEIAGLMIERGANPQKVCDLVYYDCRPEKLKLVGRVLNSVEFFRERQICTLSMTHAMLAETDAEKSESEGVVDYTLFSRGVIVGVLFKESSPKETKASLRSKNGINVAEVASHFGGGGHFNAAGCTIPFGLEKAKEELIRLINAALDEKENAN
jgi:phosphoesterase RecJ-like protein